MDISKTPDSIRRLNLASLNAELDRTIKEASFNLEIPEKIQKPKVKYSSQINRYDELENFKYESDKSDYKVIIDDVDLIADLLKSDTYKKSAPLLIKKTKKVLSKDFKLIKNVDVNNIRKLKIKLRVNIAGWFAQIQGGDRSIVSGLVKNDFEVITGQKRFGRGLDRNGAIKHIRRLSSMVDAKLIVCGDIKKSPTLVIKERSISKVRNRYILGYVNNISELSLILGSESTDMDSFNAKLRSTLFRFDTSIDVTNNIVSISAGKDNFEFVFPFHPKMLSAALDELDNSEAVEF